MHLPIDLVQFLMEKIAFSPLKLMGKMFFFLICYIFKTVSDLSV